jgi:LemA protein
MNIGLLGVLLVLIFALAAIYNALIKKRNYVDEAFSVMNGILKKRHDLIPNLIETVKASMTHEGDLLVKVSELSSNAMNPNLTFNEKVVAENQLGQAVGSIMIAIEKYPDLKANMDFMQIQNTISDVEFETSGARKVYNSKVVDFNNAVDMFPTNLMAKLMGLARRLFFEIQDTERENLEVKTLFGNK